jgi:integrase
MVDGTRYRETFPNHAEAEAWEHAARAALALGKPVPSPAFGTSKQAGGDTIGRFVEHVHKVRWSSLKAGHVPLANARRFASWVGPEVSLETALSTEKLHDYLEHLTDDLQVSGSTCNRHLSAVSAVAKMAHSLRKIAAMPDVPWQKEAAGRVRWYTHEEVQKITSSLQFWGFDDYADLVTFAVNTGLRRSELKRLTWADWTRSDGVERVSIWETKNSEPRSVPLSGPARAALKRQRERGLGGPFEWLDYGTLRRLWDRLRAEHPWMGDDAVFHTTRHTCASWLVQGGMELLRVKTWMGHKAIQTTLRYSHLAPKHLQEGLEALERSRAA